MNRKEIVLILLIGVSYMIGKHQKIEQKESTIKAYRVDLISCVNSAQKSTQQNKAIFRLYEVAKAQRDACHQMDAYRHQKRAQN